MQFFNSEQKSHLVHGKQPLLKPSPPSLTAMAVLCDEVGDGRCPLQH